MLFSKLVTLLLSAIPAVFAAAQPPQFVIERDAVYQTAFGDQFYGAICAGNGEYFAGWVDLRWGGLAGGGYDLYAQRIRPDGSVVHQGSNALIHDPAREVSGVPAVAFNGSVYLTVWYQGATLYGIRTALDGTILDPGGFIIRIAGSQFNWPAVASDGQDFLVIQAGAGSVTATRVSGAGDVLDAAPIPISSGASGLGYPKVAFGDGVYLVTWAQTPAQAIRAARVTPAGTLLDPGGINISGGGRDVDSFVDFDGSRFYVVWSRGHGDFFWDIWGTHVAPDGVTDVPSLVLDGPSWGFVGSNQVAFNGTHHLIAITTGEPIFSNTDLYAMFVDTAGNSEGSPFPVATLEGRSSTSYGVASVSDQFFVIWEGDYVSGVSFVYDTEGARITDAGDVLDRPVPVSVSTGAAWQLEPAVSFDGTNFLAVFEDRREPPPSYQADLYAVRISQSGVPLETSAIKLATGPSGSPQQEPDSVFGLGQHAVVYESANTVNEIRFVRILPNGTVLDPEGRLIFADEPTGEALRPKIACNGQTYCVVWYDNYLFSGQQPLQFALVRADGTIAVSTKNVPASMGASLDGFEIASNGSEFLLAWTDFPFSGSGAIRVTRISAAGAVLGTQSIESTSNWITEAPQVGWNGQSYLVAWTRWSEDGPSVYARRVSAAGAGLGSTVFVDGPFHPADIATGIFAQGTDFFMTGWRGSTEFALDQHYLARFDATGALQGPVEVLSSTFRGDARGAAATFITPDSLMLSVEPVWTGNPYNGVRLQGRIYDFGPGCAADLNGDGVIDFADYLEFLNLFDSSDPRADLNGDGVIDFGDYLEFLNHFDAGC